MANVGEFLLLSQVEHIVEHSWKIVMAHLVEGELPELFPSRVEKRVLSAVCVPPEVPHPHVIASVRKNES